MTSANIKADNTLKDRDCGIGIKAEIAVFWSFLQSRDYLILLTSSRFTKDPRLYNIIFNNRKLPLLLQDYMKTGKHNPFIIFLLNGLESLNKFL